MTENKKIIIEAAEVVARRYGVQRATICDIAKEAGLSRQTIYSVMGSKENVIAEVICHNEMQRLQSIKQHFCKCKSLTEQLDVYLNERVVIPFERIRNEPNILEVWANPEVHGHPSIKESEQADIHFLSEFFVPYSDKLGEAGQSPAQFAKFVVFSCNSLKVTPITREMLDEFIRTIKSTILIMLVRDVPE